VQFTEQARAALMPLIHKVLDRIGGPLTVDAGEAGPATAAADPGLRIFFTGVLLQARTMQHEEDVLVLFFELSTTAFQGFVYPPDVAAAIDELLAAAEQIAFTMTASDHLRH